MRLLALRPSRRSRLAQPYTAVVIEGYPRSGNTFAVSAFEMVNGTELHIGHHLHVAAHVARGVRLGLPTMVLIRDPIAAAASYVIREQGVTLRQALLEYANYYTSIRDYHRFFVVAPFSVVTTDFGSIIDRVNVRFGTSFARYNNSPWNDARCMRLVEQRNRRESGGSLVETHVGRPSHEREALKNKVMQELTDDRLSSLVDWCKAIYAEYNDLGTATTPQSKWSEG